MEIQQLRYFLEVARLGNMTKAAEKLHIAQPALSQSIKRLEQDLGAPVFQRNGKRIQLNHAGNVLLKKIQPIMETLNDLPFLIQDASGVAHRTITINSLSASQLTTDIIIAYKKLHPDVNFIVNQSWSDEDWDVCFTTVGSSNNAVAAGVVKGTAVPFDEEICLAVPISLVGNYTPSNRLSSFAKAPFITFTGRRPFKGICEDLCHTAGFTPRLAFQSDNPTSVRDLIAAGLGIAFWPMFSWGPMESENVVLLHMDEPICHRTLVVKKGSAVLPDTPQSDFFDFAVQYLTNLKQSNFNKTEAFLK